MKLVLLSGAGLSAGSGIPTYQERTMSEEFKDFFSASETQALQILQSYKHIFDGATPNSAHHECKKIEEFCRAVNIEFQHFTLNVDSLIEKENGTVTHIYGCVDDPVTVVNSRFSEASIVDDLIWSQDDILVILGVSDNGYPIGILEAKVLQASGQVINYNIEHNSNLFCDQIIGSVTDTLKSIEVTSKLPLVFKELDLGTYKVDTYGININGLNYIVYFSPSIHFYNEMDLLEDIQTFIGHQLTHSSFEVKFDYEPNIEGGVETQFKAPVGPPLSLLNLNILGHTLCSLINIHKNQYGGEFYTASAAHSRLVRFYNKLAKQYCNTLKYGHWLEINLNEEIYYVIKTH